MLDICFIFVYPVSDKQKKTNGDYKMKYNKQSQIAALILGLAVLFFGAFLVIASADELVQIEHFSLSTRIDNDGKMHLTTHYFADEEMSESLGISETSFNCETGQFETSEIVDVPQSFGEFSQLEIVAGIEYISYEIAYYLNHGQEGFFPEWRPESFFNDDSEVSQQNWSTMQNFKFEYSELSTMCPVSYTIHLPIVSK